MTSKNPPPTASINEILEESQKPFKGQENPAMQEMAVHDLKTALYTLIASKAPKQQATGMLRHDVRFTATGYNQALKDYDNAIKEVFK